MINVAIYGQNEYGRAARVLVEEFYNPFAAGRGEEELQLLCYVDRIDEETESPAGEDVIALNLEEFSRLYEKNVLEAMILPVPNHDEEDGLVLWLRERGIRPEDVYYLPRRFFEGDFGAEDAENLLIPLPQTDYLPSLRYSVTPFSGADGSEAGCGEGNSKGADFDRFMENLSRLREAVGDIGTIDIVNRGPFLNPELAKYVILTRKLYPYSVICVETDKGMEAAEKAPESLLAVMGRLDVSFREAQGGKEAGKWAGKSMNLSGSLLTAEEMKGELCAMYG